MRSRSLFLLFLCVGLLPLTNSRGGERQQSFSRSSRKKKGGSNRTDHHRLSPAPLQVVGCTTCPAGSPCFNSGNSQCYPLLQAWGASSSDSYQSCPAGSAPCAPLQLSYRQQCTRCTGESSGDCVNTLNGACFSSVSPNWSCPFGTAPCQRGMASSSPIVPTVACEGLCTPARACLHSLARECYNAEKDGRCPNGTRPCGAEPSSLSQLLPPSSPSPCSSCATGSPGSACINTLDSTCYDLIGGRCPTNTAQCLLGPSMFDPTVPSPTPLFNGDGSSSATPSSFSSTFSPRSPLSPPVSDATGTIPSGAPHLPGPSGTSPLTPSDNQRTKALSGDDPLTCTSCSSALPCAILSPSSAEEVCVAALTAQDFSTTITKRNSSLLLFCPTASACCSTFSTLCSYATRYCYARNHSDDDWCNDVCNRRGSVNCPSFCVCSETDREEDTSAPSQPEDGKSSPSLPSAVKVMLIVFASLAGAALFGSIVMLIIVRCRKRQRQIEEVLHFEDEREDHYTAL